MMLTKVSMLRLKRILSSLCLLLAGLVWIIGVAGCSSTPEETIDHSTHPADVVPGCEDSKNPLDCRLRNKTGGSDVPTVDNMKETTP